MYNIVYARVIERSVRLVGDNYGKNKKKKKETKQKAKDGRKKKISRNGPRSRQSRLYRCFLAVLFLLHLRMCVHTYYLVCKSTYVCMYIHTICIHTHKTVGVVGLGTCRRSF